VEEDQVRDESNGRRIEIDNVLLVLRFIRGRTPIARDGDKEPGGAKRSTHEARGHDGP